MHRDDGAAQAAAGFVRAFGTAPHRVAFAPGRVNLIGEHVDYVDGMVLPVAINRGTWVAARANRSGRVVMHSALSQSASDPAAGGLDVARIALDDARADQPAWAPYVRGVLALSAQPPARMGVQMYAHGDLPIGAGLSSSASLQLAVLVAAQAVGWPHAAPEKNARTAQHAEHKFAHVHCGIMDQLAVACGRVGHALLIDCRNLSVEHVHIPQSVKLLVLDTGASRALAGSAYNARRAAGETAARLLKVTLREVSDRSLCYARLPQALIPTVRHVVTEIRRTTRMAAALVRGDLFSAGQLMRASHASLRHDLQVSSPALDAMVDEASKQDGVWGARMTGAGFGGCVVALAEAGCDAEAILSRYRRRHPELSARALVVRASAGASLVG